MVYFGRFLVLVSADPWPEQKIVCQTGHGTPALIMAAEAQAPALKKENGSPPTLPRCGFFFMGLLPCPQIAPDGATYR